jgi:hypothetical protein
LERVEIISGFEAAQAANNLLNAKRSLLAWQEDPTHYPHHAIPSLPGWLPVSSSAVFKTNIALPGSSSYRKAAVTAVYELW